MRIAIVTSERYHLLDLARELDALGHDVRFYSWVSRKRAREHGLSPKCHRNFRRFVLAWSLLEGKGPENWRRFLESTLQSMFDRAVARRLARCDVLIGLSGLCLRTIRRARTKFGAKTFLERSTRHVLSQKDILEDIPGVPRPAISHFELKRELSGYALADVVVVASRHAEESFLDRGLLPERLFRNPTGVDLDGFFPTARPDLDALTILYMGTWSRRKGCDVLARAVEGERWRLVHVGPMGDAPLPNLTRFEQRGLVHRWELPFIYRKADIFVCPSREESLNLAQIQALASGLPVVCTDHSGGADLREFLGDPKWITVVPAGDLNALRDGIAQGFARAREQSGARRILGDAARDHLSMQSYVRRYDEELRRRLLIAQEAPPSMDPSPAQAEVVQR